MIIDARNVVVLFIDFYHFDDCIVSQLRFSLIRSGNERRKCNLFHVHFSVLQKLFFNRLTLASFVLHFLQANETHFYFRHHENGIACHRLQSASDVKLQ